MELIRYAYYMGDVSGDVETIARGVMQLARRMRMARSVGAIPSAAVALLATLRRQGPMPAARLAEAEGLQPQSLSRLVAKLEASGLIARDPDPADGRALVIRVTTPGLIALRDDMVLRYAWLDAAMGERLSSDEQARLAAAAELMIKLADLPQSGGGG
jgi:DNA-binding MarR family transcriptional regulator